MDADEVFGFLVLVLGFGFEQRVTALKRAYADIILNTAKEAAARIMVSERKAVGFQHELNVAKEQALQTLLRLKQMMDSKGGEAGVTYLSQQKMIEDLEARLREAEDTINEAEMTSLSQRQKIEELEAQLEEAEDIVKDVREELREVQAELERVRNSKSQQMDLNDTVAEEQASQANKLITSQSVTPPPAKSQLLPSTTSDTKNSAFNQKNELYEDSYISNSHISKPDLPSTSEENRLNISRSILSTHPDSGLNSLMASGVKNLASNQRNEVSKGYDNSNGFPMGSLNIRKPEVPSVILRSNEPTPYRNRRTQRILAFEEKLMAGELAFSETTNDMNYVTSGREDGEESEDEGTRKTSIKKKKVVRDVKGRNQVLKVKSFQRKRKRATRYKKIETLSSRNLSNEVIKSDRTISCAETISVNISAQSCRDPSTMAPRPSADKENEDPPLGSTKIAEHDAQLDKAVKVENLTNMDKASIDQLQLMRHERGFADSLGVMICGVDVEKVDVPVVNTQAKMSDLNDEIPSQRELGSRVIKFTFQRKRKREFMVNGNASLVESILLEKAPEKQNVMLETEMSGSITDPPRDSWRLAQVARQSLKNSDIIHLLIAMDFLPLIVIEASQAFALEKATTKGSAHKMLHMKVQVALNQTPYFRLVPFCEKQNNVIMKIFIMLDVFEGSPKCRSSVGYLKHYLNKNFNVVLDTLFGVLTGIPFASLVMDRIRPSEHGQMCFIHRVTNAHSFIQDRCVSLTESPMLD
ncbi:hypothetical protein RHSIM_Rhsim12G0160600 [Rhododendron simsii]|uniref:Uncharacterized protein n=1 Tax=Rhododendron simsii TaxID=118357 RepID=A0A834G304_RHOSS|nr:hypothetical protein RHSIM_Rhsim12G0160600 [Rhododendron simsii]